MTEPCPGLTQTPFDGAALRFPCSGDQLARRLGCVTASLLILIAAPYRPLTTCRKRTGVRAARICYVGGVGVPEHIVSIASVHGELRRVTTGVQDAWTRARAFLHGLGIAWVSTASVLLALVLFAIAPPAQDLFLEVRGSRQIGFEFWLGTYTLIVLAWVLPVYISARWILCNARRQDVLPAHTHPVEDWVASAVPRVLALACLLAVLVGQVMALSNAPTLPDPISEVRAQQLEAKLSSECPAVMDMWDAVACAFGSVDRLPALAELLTIGYTREVTPENTIYLLYALIFGPLLFFAASRIWRAMYGGGAYWRALFITFAVCAFVVCALVLSDNFDSGPGRLLFGWLPEPVRVAIVLVSIFAAWSLTLFFFNLIPWKWVRIPLKVLWWAPTLFVVAICVGWVAVLGYGFIASQLALRLGLGHVALLPLITLIVAYGVWKVFRAPTTEAAASEEPLGASRRVTLVFAITLGISGLVLAIQPFLNPVMVTDYIYRGLVAPILLGVLVPAFTLLSLMSLRLRLPIVALVIAAFVVMIIVRGRLNDVRPVTRLAQRPTLEDSVNRWKKVNECDPDLNPGKKCPPPIIVAAAGGASRAAFLTATVIGKLLDDKSGLRPFGNQLFAISAVSGGALGAVITYAALADSQTPGRTKNGLGAPPCDAGAPDTEWFLSGPAWGKSEQDPSELTRPIEPDKSWRQCLQRIVAGDFLSPVFVSLISNDLLGLSLLGDRAAVLEDAWEQRYAVQTGQKDDYFVELSTLQRSMVNLRQQVLALSKVSWLPVLLLNGTSETTGRRIITSDMDTLLARTSAVGHTKSRLFRDAYDLHELFEVRKNFDFGRFIPDGRMLTVVNDTVLFWDTKTGEEQRSRAIRNTADDAKADGAKARTGKAGDAKETPLGYIQSALLGNAKDWFIRSAENSRDGKLLLITDNGGRASVWDLDAHRRLWSRSTSAEEPETLSTEWRRVGDWEKSPAHFSPNADLVLMPHGNRTVSLRRALTGDEVKSFSAPQDSTIEAAAFTQAGVRVLTVGPEDGLRQIWDLNSDPKRMKPLVDLKDGNPDSGEAVFSPDGKQLLTVSRNGMAVLWNAVTGAKVVPVEVQSGSKNKYAFSSDGRKFIVTAPHRLVISPTSGDSPPVFLDSTSEKGIQSATLSNDGKRVLVVDDITAELWDLEPPRRLHTFKGEEGFVQGAVFSADDSQVLTWSDNGVAIVWDANTGDQKRIFSISRSSMAECGTCDIRLSTAATMSARFPIISPHGNIRHKDGQLADRVVDGGYFENFGATTARELAIELHDNYNLEPTIILINNEPATSGMNCISDGNRLQPPAPPRTITIPIIEAPIYTMLETRSARGSHAAVELCLSISEQSPTEKKFAYVTVEPDEPGKELSVSWWLSKYVQSRLDAQVRYGDLSDLDGAVAHASPNDSSFATINGWRAH